MGRRRGRAQRRRPCAFEKAPAGPRGSTRGREQGGGQQREDRNWREDGGELDIARRAVVGRVSARRTGEEACLVGAGRWENRRSSVYDGDFRPKHGTSCGDRREGRWKALEETRVILSAICWEGRVQQESLRDERRLCRAGKLGRCKARVAARTYMWIVVSCTRTGWMRGHGTGDGQGGKPKVLFYYNNGEYKSYI